MSRRKGRETPPPAALPVPRVRTLRDEDGLQPPDQGAGTPAPRPPPAAPFARRRRTRFVF
jgi:hypothetical protein